MDNLEQLSGFIVRAKSMTYVGSGKHIPSCRFGSSDLEYTEGEYRYLDSYFGGKDFLGEEIVWMGSCPVWGMNYYGKILQSNLITAEEAGAMIKRSLTLLYREGRFLGGFEHRHEDLLYRDSSTGGLDNFQGVEEIFRGDTLAYRLFYHGGMIE
jgi:hypothetical protein